MLPYIPQPTLTLGPLTIYAFGVLVAAAVLVGAMVLKRRALQQGLDLELATRLLTWIVAGGFLGAHLVLDFLRIEDARYFGLTPAQYGSVALFFVGLAIHRHAI